MGAAAADASPLRLCLNAAAADGKTDASPLRLRFGAAAADVKAEYLVLNSLRLEAGSWRWDSRWLETGGCCAVALLRSGAAAQWRGCAVARLRSSTVAQWRCCAVALDAGDWRREAGSEKLEAWRCGCFDEAGDLWLETGGWRLEAGCWLL